MQALCVKILLGTMKFSNGVLSLMTALGRTKAPVASSRISGVDGDDGFVVNTTLAKWVGTDTLGGEPITSCVCHNILSANQAVHAVGVHSQCATSRLLLA